MKLAVDTSAVVRLVNRSDPLYQLVEQRICAHLASGDDLCLAPQVLFEFWVVATRSPDANGLGLTVATAHEIVQEIVKTFELLLEPSDLWLRWLSLCTSFEVKGRRAHDARLVAWMQAHEIKNLLTLNPSDFRGFPDIVLESANSAA